MSAIVMELRKLRRRHFWLMATALGAMVVIWSAGLLVTRANGAEPMRLLSLSLTDSVNMTAMLMPFSAALLASRLATIDTEERMGQWLTAIGQAERSRFRGKLLLGSFAVVVGQLAMLGITVLTGPGMGLRTAPEDRGMIWSIAVIMIAASVAAMAAQLVLAICVPKQAVGLGAGALASLFCSALPFMHLGAVDWLFPWGIAGAARPVLQPSQQAGEVILVGSPWINALWAALSAVLWTALAGFVINYRENHR
ncbi:ABC transporter permease [Actinomyces sp.]|uniref:ABC transporter permease n=1 Tax=Actinomyces sp. TaxID=29317 RepID=UPI0026DB367E|nr:ABC transporter permease [Actinomyces sp.]MDO4900036.1 ABC transporter permease [Actinomyces sp.]